MTLNIGPTTSPHDAWKPFRLWCWGPHIGICEVVLLLKTSQENCYLFLQTAPMNVPPFQEVAIKQAWHVL
jgi:hypothetical protein